MNRKVDILGKKFGRLLVMEETNKRLDKKVVWKCLCDCGNITEVIGKNLRNGNTKSCGCLYKESRIISKNLKHGHNKKSGQESRTYNTWQKMKQRCLNPKATGYKNYGGRGIMVCERWMKFENFLVDMGERPEGLTLDRKDNDGHYESSNCKWATPKEQYENSRIKHVNGRFKTC